MEGSVSGIDSRSKIESILKTLKHQLINASITESMLQTLEELEQHLLTSGSSSNPITTSMKAAYCAIAVHCTLNHPQFKTTNPTHFGALKKIWKSRVHDKPTFLFSDHFQNKKYVINTLSCIPNTHNDALHKLQLFLAQVTHNLGLPLNDSPVKASLNKGKSFTTVDAENVNDTTTCGKFNSMSIHELPKTGESPQCSSVELENLGIEDMNQEAQLENHSPDDYVPNSQASQTMNNNEAILKNSTYTHQRDVHHSSLMQPNESDDSIGGLQGGTSDPTRLTLPSPKKKRKLPLFIMYEPRYISKRRRTRRWSQWEVDNLMAGVKEYGRSWKKIHDNFTFDKRTQVDLKDKWRNMFGE